MPSKFRSPWRPLVGLLGVLLALALTSPALAERPLVFPPGSQPFGLSYNQWNALWWQEAATVSMAPRSPFEPGAVNCARLGTGRVVFLAGVAGTSGAVERSCTIAANTAILLPLINVELSTNEGYAVSELRSAVSDIADQFTTLHATVDGVSIGNLGAFRFPSPLFPWFVVPDNYFDIPTPGPGLSVADGYYVMIAPLAPGTHTVSFGGELPEVFLTQATYRLTVRR